MSNSRTSAAQLASFAILILALPACRAGYQQPWYAETDECFEHADCGLQLCLEARCAPRAADGPLSAPAPAALPASCRFDHECLGWVCVDGACAEPVAAGMPRPRHSEVRFWDGSCLAHADCGPRVCASGWCADPDRIGPTARFPEGPEGRTGDRVCISDAQCDEGSDCVYPGLCVAGADAEPFAFSEVEWTLDAATYPDGSCNLDADCVGRVCATGWCLPADVARGLALPRRGELLYADGSCGGDADCGPWRCVDRWCRAPERVGVDFGSPGDDSLAARARADGALDAALVPDAAWLVENVLDTVDAGELDDDEFKDDDYGLLGALGSSSSWQSAGLIGGLSGTGFGAIGTGTGYGQGYGIGGLGSSSSLSANASWCSEQSDCPTGDACVFPGDCRPNAATEPFTTAEIDTWGAAGDACFSVRDCGPMECSGGVCSPVEDRVTTMPERREIRFHDGSCISTVDCGPWTCRDGWCRAP